MDDSMNGRDSRAIEGLIQLLPNRFKPALSALALQARGSGAGETELFGELRRCLNLCVTEGLLDRRAFLRIGSLLVSAGLLSAIFPQSAAAAGPMMPFAFWKKRNPPGSGPSGYPANTGSDPYWDYVVLLMNMDTASGVPTTLFADDSNVGKTPTVGGAPYIDTLAGSSPYSGGTGAGRFNGSTDAVVYSNSSDFDFSTGDFTIETWVRLDATGTYFGGIVGKRDNSAAGWFFLVNLNNKVQFGGKIGGTWLDPIIVSNATLDTQWHHVAVTRQSGTLRLFIDGVVDATGTNAGAIENTSHSLAVAQTDSTVWQYALKGRLADLRIYKGVAKYTANFIPRTTPVGMGTANDKYWGYCVLACPFENTLKDMSGNRAIVSGDAQLNASTKKFGSASASFDGTGDWVSYANTAAFTLGAGDFTLEAWAYFTTSGTHSYLICCAKAPDGNNSGARFYRSNANKLSAKVGPTSFTGTTSIAAGEWVHLAVSRSAGTVKLFVNGQLDGSGVDSTNLTDDYCIVGADFDTTNRLTGYIDSLRITKGYARYTSNFTPPAAAFPVGKDETVDPFWTYTVLAMHMDDFTDSTGRHSITNNGSVTSNTSTYKYGTASASFNGTSQYLSLDTSNDWSFGTGDFTVEFWVRPTIVDTHRRWLTNTTAAFDANTFCIRQSGSGIYCICGTGDVTITNGVIANAWLHFVVVRKGSTVSVFCNGAMSGSFTSSSDLSKSQLFIGGYHSGAEYFQGYIDDLRITKGIARYTQNFTPPTRAFATSDALAGDPFWSQTMLLMTMDNLTDATGRQAVTNNGTVTNNTSTYKHGTASASFSGSGQYLSCASSADFAFGTGDFTIEFWFYLNVVTGYQYLFDMRSGANLYFYMDNAYSGATGNLSASTWYHFALCRSSGTARTYLNGTQMTSGADSSSYGTASFRIGARYVTSEYLNGYIDDLRITKGVARYTASFDPPSRALPSLAGAADVTSSIVTSGLVCYLDAGDGRSFAGGSAQKWRNMTASPADGSSQNAYDFFLGASSSSESTDPTFVGVSGGRSANDYFSFDGGDYFTLAGSNSTFLNSLHKDSATFTIIVVAYVANASAWNNWITNFSLGTDYGIAFQLTNTAKIKFAAYNGTASLEKVSDAAVSTGLHFIAVSLNEASTGFFYRNGGYEKVASADTWTAAYSGPSSTNASYSLKIGADGAAVVPLGNGSRVYLVQIYNRALTKAELDQNFAAMRSRFGI